MTTMKQAEKNMQTMQKAFKKLGEVGAPIPITKEIDATKIKFYQTELSLETIAIVEYGDGSISVGIARAGRVDIENKRITSEEGMNIAKGRALKARREGGSLIEKNYLRGIYVMRIEK